MANAAAKTVPDHRKIPTIFRDSDCNIPGNNHFLLDLPVQ